MLLELLVNEILIIKNFYDVILRVIIELDNKRLYHSKEILERNAFVVFAPVARKEFEKKFNLLLL